MFLWWRTNVSWKYPPPLSCVHEKFSRRLRVTFKWFGFYFERKWLTGGFFLPNGTNFVNFSIGTILQWITLGYCNLNTYENEEVAFIGQRSGEHFAEKMAALWRNVEGHNIEDKIHCTVSHYSQLDETWLKSSLAIYHYVKVQQLDDICQIRR
jgi:hypothetical protein